MNSNQAEGLVGNKAFTFRILRTGDKSGTNSVQWAVNGSGVNAATATDFSGGILPSGTVNFTPGQSSQLISVNVSGDTIVGASESFQVVLSSPTNGATLGAATASGVIINDDGTLAIAPVNADRDEGASGAKRFLFTVTRTGTLSRAHAATWSVTGSGAHPASATDFAGGVLPSGEARFAPGQRIATIAVSVAGDTAVEADEHFTVTLSDPALGYGITTGSAVGTILNDDANVLTAGNISLAARTTFAAGPVPSSVIAVDLDLDGNLDLAVPDFFGSLSILLGDGTGGFAPATNTATGSSPHSVATADFNLDGLPDLATANNGDDTVSVLFGDGLGGFSAPHSFGTGSHPIPIAAADLNGDGKADLVVTNSFSNTVSVLLGDGAGGFAPQVTFATSSNPRSLVAADLNGDGNIDLTVGNWGTSSISVLLGDGTGSFAPRTSYATGSNPASVITADMNSDGKIDLVVSNLLSDTISVLAGDGTGNFAPQVTFATGVGPNPVFAVDLNEDGRTDLVVANGGENSVSVHLNDTMLPNISGTALADFVDLSAVSASATVDLAGNTASVSIGLPARRLSFIGLPDKIVLGAGPVHIDYALTAGSGVEIVANFQYGLGTLDIDFLGAPASDFIALNVKVGGQHALALTSIGDLTHGVVLIGIDPGMTAADLIASHVPYAGGHVIVA